MPIAATQPQSAAAAALDLLDQLARIDRLTLPGARGQKDADAAADHKGASLIEQGFGRAVEQQNPTLGIGHDHPVKRGLKAGPQVGIEPFHHCVAQGALPVKMR